MSAREEISAQPLQRQRSFYNTHVVDSLKRTLIHVSSFVAVLVSLIWLSLFMYSSFYYMYMPAVLHVRDVNLLFRTDCETERKLCSFPAANMSLVSEGQSRLLMRGQTYVLMLEIEMPESARNQQLGMFIVLVQLFSHGGEVVRSSSRAVMLHYKSAMLQIIETIFRLPTLLIGTMEQKQVLALQIFEHFSEDPYKPATGIYVQVQNKRLEIYSTTLKIHAQFAGLRYLLFYWPVLSAVMGVATNLFILSVLTLTVWYRMALGGSGSSYGAHYELLDDTRISTDQPADADELAAADTEDSTDVDTIGAATQDDSSDEWSVASMPEYVPSVDRGEWRVEELPLTASLTTAVRHRQTSTSEP